MTRDEELAERLKEMDNELDQEQFHLQADALLCDLLRAEFPLTVAAFEAGGKWYA